jgi:hypothetical protein
MGRSQTGRPCGPHLLVARPCDPTTSSGISSPFELLSRRPGYVTHELLSLPPLDILLCPVRLACLNHAASVRSEPGSNSSNRVRSERPEGRPYPERYGWLKHSRLRARMFDALRNALHAPLSRNATDARSAVNHEARPRCADRPCVATFSRLLVHCSLVREHTAPLCAENRRY